MTAIAERTDAESSAAGKKATSKTAAAKTGKGAGKKKGKKMLIIAVLLIVVIAAVGYLEFLKPKPKPGPPLPGKVVAMDDMTLNLAGGHYLKLKVALQLIKGKEAKLEDTSQAAQATINEFTGRDMSTLATTAERTKLQKQLLGTIQADYPQTVLDIYVTEFVIQ